MPAFISHSSKDQAIYSTLCMALDAVGIKRWDHTMMSAGASLTDQLREAIKTCEVCVFLATRRSIESPWCLAELGAFWGANKNVLLFMADPDLTETVLPPQFTGTLRVHTAETLIRELKKADEEQRVLQIPDKFIAKSGDYGLEKDWAPLLDDTEKHFDVIGIAIGAWRKESNFRERVLKRAEAGCKVRFLLMHQDNELLKGLLYNDRKLDSVRHDIKESHEYYYDLAQGHPNISVRQMKVGIPHFFVTRSDKYAIVILYLSSSTWGSGPTWQCAASSPLFKIAADEFEHMWKTATDA